MFVQLRKALVAIAEVLDIPVKLVLLFLNTLVILSWLCAASMLGYYAITGLIASEIPIIYLVAKEAWRQIHMLPMTDRFELTTAEMDTALEQYVLMIKREEDGEH